ncbi:MAG TPA: toll/interleukin-1 receptor domain-containing protein [Thermoanaerobaculia bacterium]|nr:toll/interleukin-1 receptor domain-containing protein [Thermoanaerobaculia bacterium]
MSGFVPGFENDLFISYSHAEDPAWIQAFEKSLGEELSRRLGLGVSVWQDAKRLRVGQNWHLEIEYGVQRSAAFLAVLSPCYENSDWCTRERGFFRQLFPTPGTFESSNRFFKILKTPWQNDEHQYFLSAIQNQNFFRREEGPAGDVEFLPGSDDFRSSIGSLAHAIAQTLRQLRRERERVFVGSPSESCLDVWKQLREELRTKGYDVQPAGRRNADFADDLIRRELENALLSVHLLGADYDPFVERQIQLAADLEQRLIFWLAPGAGGTADASQTRLIEALRNGQRPDRPSVTLPPGWALLPDRPARRLVEEVLAELKPKPTAEAQPSANGVSRLYIVHDATTEEDTRLASDLKEQIVQREGLNVFLSRADLASAADLRQRHEKLMQTCEGVLLCRSAAPEAWMMQVAPEVIFAEKLLQRGPFKSRAFLVSDPAPWATFNLQAISYSPQFRLGDLEPFLAPLRASGGIAHAV